MGMAASQARWLALTARKTNVEYEGQQVNQARTALANISANTFNDLLALEVPTAPSTQDYTTFQYSYKDGTNTETVTLMDPINNDPDGYNYMITHHHYSDVFTGIETRRTNPQVYIDEGVPTYVGNCKVSAYDSDDTDQVLALEEIRSRFPNSNIGKVPEDQMSSQIFTWEFQGTRYYATLEDLEKSFNSAKDHTKPTENQDKLTMYYAEPFSTKIEVTQKAFVDLDNSGRPQSIRYEDSTAIYALNTETITDENAYNDAMNQYHYDMEVYEKKIADINAKTKKLQEQDRTLELRLRQLDTEQEALQTEMEAVKKVIDKNIESTFKTFE